MSRLHLLVLGALCGAFDFLAATVALAAGMKSTSRAEEKPAMYARMQVIARQILAIHAERGFAVQAGGGESDLPRPALP